jgi:hypothetical protein
MVAPRNHGDEEQVEANSSGRHPKAALRSARREDDDADRQKNRAQALRQDLWNRQSQAFDRDAEVGEVGRQLGPAGEEDYRDEHRCRGQESLGAPPEPGEQVGKGARRVGRTEGL